MDRNIKEQDEIVSRMTENEAAGDHLNDIDSLINEHNLLNHKFSCEEARQGIIVEVVGGGVLRLGLAAEVENAAQVSNNSVKPMTPLHIAALQGRVDVVQNMIHHGADVHAEDEHGCTALRIAAQKGDYHCLKVLIEAGADAFASIGMSCRATAFRKLGASALITAVQHNHIDCVQELLQYGVDSNAVDERGQSFRDIVAEKAINNCIPAFLKTDNNEVRTDGYLEVMLRYRIGDYGRKLLLIGSLDKYIERKGILELCKFISSGIEDADVEIFKVFILESYSIDHNIPRGLTTLRHLGFEYYNSKIAAILITCFADIVVKDELLNMNIIEYLLRTSDRFETLKFVVKCIPWVPHINSLTTLPIVNKLPNHQFYDANSENFVLPPNVAFVLECDQTCIYVAIHDREKELTELELKFSDIVRGNPKYGRYPLKQPLINLIDKRISDEIDQLDLIIEDPLCENHFYYRMYRAELKTLKKYLWCEKIASNPPTLRQCCRYSLLKCLGPLNVENIRKLPLPNELQSYLLLQ